MRCIYDIIRITPYFLKEFPLFFDTLLQAVALYRVEASALLISLYEDLIGSIHKKDTIAHPVSLHLV